MAKHKISGISSVGVADKIFEVKNGVVEIWEPVRRYVEEYKKAVFNGRY